jgi:poly(A) polymerase
VQFPEIIFQLKKFSAQSTPIYLVGGAVRDALIGQRSKDFDFVCTANTRNIARRFADENNAAFFMLDEERNTCRVLIAHGTADQMVFDFAQLRGESIESDLLERDFTINAMAFDLNSPERVIDPTKGGRDLQQKWLRPVKNSSIEDDPVRAIRAVRYAVNLGLKIEPKTAQIIQAGAKKLDKISVERKRDEIFKIFEGQSIGTSLQLLRRFSILDEMGIPVSNGFERACRQINVLHDMLALLCDKGMNDKNASFYSTSLLLRLGRFKNELEKNYYKKSITGRDRKSLLFLYLLTDHKLQNELNDQYSSLLLSIDEIDALKEIAKNSGLIESLLANPGKLENRSVYKFYKTAGEVGIDLVFLSLSEYASRLGSEFAQDQWLRLLEICEKLVEALYNQPDVVSPKPYLNGNDLMFNFDLIPGPLIGELIERMKEEQAAGNIKSKEDALDWVDLRLQRNSL